MTPSTPSGRRLLDESAFFEARTGRTIYEWVSTEPLNDSILAIEREAVEAYRLVTPLPEGAAPSLDVERLARALAPEFATYPPAVTTRERDRDYRDMVRLAERVAAAYLRESLPQPQDET